MVIDTALPGEQDSDDPETVVAFLTKAFSDCVNKGLTEYLLIFSSHGAGTYPFCFVCFVFASVCRKINYYKEEVFCLFFYFIYLNF